MDLGPRLPLTSNLSDVLRGGLRAEMLDGTGAVSLEDGVGIAVPAYLASGLTGLASPSVGEPQASADIQPMDVEGLAALGQLSALQGIWEQQTLNALLSGSSFGSLTPSTPTSVADLLRQLGSSLPAAPGNDGLYSAADEQPPVLVSQPLPKKMKSETRVLLPSPPRRRPGLTPRLSGLQSGARAY